ncbi:MAG: glutamyl-tRNA reductase [Candidatus Poribacteria bacterium]
MYISVVGVSHKRTPLEVRERLAFDNSYLPKLFEKLKVTGEVAGCVILSTCNRTEIYAASKDVDAALAEIWKLLAAESGMEVEQLQDYLYNLTCQQAITHLFRVAAGLDSMILGETEILGQVSKAYQIAHEYSASNSALNFLFQKALKVGKQVRTETRIGQGAASVGSAAVELAKQVFSDIRSCFVLLIGAGEIGELVARHLAANSVSEVMVCNRSYDRAQKLALKLNGRAVPFEKLSKCISLADLVVSCTAAPDYIITKEQLSSLTERRGGEPIFLIDLAVPRDIEPEAGQLKQTYIYNIDDLQSIVDENLKERRVEAKKAEAIIEKAVDNFLKWLNSRSAVPVIKALSEKGQKIGDAELEKVLRKLGPLTEREEKLLRSMANSIVNKLLHTPIVQLRKYAQTEQGHLYAEILRNLFDLSVQIDDESAYCP